MTIHYEESGKGYPVILIHGYGETHHIWATYQERLSTKYRVLTPDLPGFGQSDPLPYDLSLDMVANSIYDWLKKKNISECIIIGHSLGGYVTLEIAKKFPNIISGIGLLHSSAFSDSDEKKIGREKSIEFIQKHGVEKFIESFVPMLFNENTRDQHQKTIQMLIEEGKKIPEKTMTDYMLAMRDRSDNIDLLKEFEKPLLFIFGEEDSSIPLAKSKEQIKYMQHPYLKSLPETGHMGMFEKEEEVYSTIAKFIEVTLK
ncbi:alpha/beta hydrolase [Marivirga sp. S37H4]|uniref:Alpha/beta hydrolase n=1 Tax=Marivirga aurantiaca TaxID=2802615 RepID=A0A934X0H9_9BACT|nr:alpha/beta hydrolase [Marivirga aurantiaca]MBK6266419.1 alpha/beta hydrolase [Marivirga aurantiaca]